MTAPRLWHDDNDVAALRRHLADGHPHLTALLERLRVLADQTAEVQLDREHDHHGQHNTVDEEYATDCAAAYLLTGDATYAERARLGGHHMLSAWSKADLGVANRSFRATIVQQCCADAWSDEERVRFNALLARCAMGINQVRPGNPYQVGNNWWAVTHSGGLLAALAVHGQGDPDGGTWDFSDIIERCSQRLAAFAQHFGDAGLYHEGLGYQVYTCSNLLPAFMALQRCGGPDFFARFANLRRMGPSLAATSALRYNLTDDANAPDGPGWGTCLSWNDAGQGWAGGVMANVLLALAPEAEQGALARWYDRLNGHASPNRLFGPYCAGRYFAAICYPYAATTQDPDRSLPKHVCDSRQGLWVVRDRYQDSDDALVGAYARATHVGGHSQHDAGSIRLLALNHDWIIGGGQARPKPEWQSIVSPMEDEWLAKGKNRGLVMWDQADEAEACMAMDLRWSSICYHERYLGVRWATETAPLAIARMDVIEHQADRQWRWTQVFADELRCELCDGGFDLHAEDGASMQVRFIGHQPDAMTLERTPDSRRTYASGGTVTYPGRPYVQAVFGGGRQLQHIYAVATVQRGDAPTLTSADAGVGLTIGDSAWERPFGGMVPTGFRLGESLNLCQFPAGFEFTFPFAIPQA